jgi:hypothetical protein
MLEKRQRGDPAARTSTATERTWLPYEFAAELADP